MQAYKTFTVSRKTVYEEIKNDRWSEKSKYETIVYGCVFAYTTITKRGDRICSMLHTKRKQQHLKNGNIIITKSDVSAE